MLSSFWTLCMHRRDAIQTSMPMFPVFLFISNWKLMRLIRCFYFYCFQYKLKQKKDEICFEKMLKYFLWRPFCIASQPYAAIFGRCGLNNMSVCGGQRPCVWSDLGLSHLCVFLDWTCFRFYFDPIRIGFF